MEAKMEERDFRAIVLHEFELGHGPAEATRNINAVRGMKVKERTVRQWFQKYASGDLGVDDKPGSESRSSPDHEELGVRLHSEGTSATSAADPGMLSETVGRAQAQIGKVKKEKQKKQHASGQSASVACTRLDRNGFIEGNWNQLCESFSDMNLKEKLLLYLYAFGFEKPSDVQQRVIVPCTTRRDVIVQAPLEIGRTVALSVSVLQNIDETVPEVQALIMAPTRKLAKQIHKVVAALGGHMGVKCHASVGGTSTLDDQRELESGVQVVVGTVGRVRDMIHRLYLRVGSIKMFVLDEADALFSNHSEDELCEVYKCMRAGVQVIVLAATMSDEVLKFADRCMNAPVKILVKEEKSTFDFVKQFYISVDNEELKFETLCDLYATVKTAEVVIFCNSCSQVHDLAQRMKKKHYTVSCMHGDMEQEERDASMRQLRSGSSAVLITTDLLARGIDAHNFSLVIGYDLPRRENYIHRVRCSCRFGRKGVAVTFVLKSEVKVLKRFESFYNTHIEELPTDLGNVL